VSVNHRLTIAWVKKDGCANERKWPQINANSAGRSVIGQHGSYFQDSALNSRNSGVAIRSSAASALLQTFASNSQLSVFATVKP
jgi:hypothetical protein